MVHVTDAVVLRLGEYGEADRVVTLLTATRGKMSALAKGARKSQRRFGGALSLFGHGEAMLRERQGQDLAILEGLHSARGFSRLGQELGRFGHASYACELCRELCPPHEPEPEVYALLVQFLGALDALPLAEKPRTEPLRVFELRLLDAVGLGPSLERCAACGGEVAGGEGDSGPPVPFDLSRGGVLCSDCWLSTASGAPMPLSREVRRALLRLKQVRPDEGGEAGLMALDLSKEALRGCRDLLLDVIQHHLGRGLRAVEFIAKLNLMTFV
jgi:DNA repair protein RecO (recombination protein O)